MGAGRGANPEGCGGIDESGTKPEAAGVGTGMNPDEEGGRLYRGPPWRAGGGNPDVGMAGDSY